MSLARLNRRATSIFSCNCNYALPSTSTHHVHALAKSDKLPATYDPKFVERGWREHWRAQQESAAVIGHDEPFSIVLPPPNVTGRLHLGHALTLTVEDAMVRWKQIHGLKTHWQPGIDHAGIATQVVVEKMLWRERKIRRTDMKRDEFLDECRSWKEKRHQEIIEQMNRFGVLLDWPKQYFTMDANFTLAVNTAFMRLYDDGLIVRDTMLVNWCPALRSSISDAEVETLTLEGNEHGFAHYARPELRQKVRLGVMYGVKYQLEEPIAGKESLEVNTTRPETIPADVALAVNPKDERYSTFIGRRVRHPLYPNRLLPIIADDAVQMDFGTGVLKVTPAHDAVDYAIGMRHGLPLDVYCFDERGYIARGTHEALDELTRFEARDEVARLLNAKEVMSTPGRPITVAVCARTGDIIEPRPMRQWFLKCKELGAATVKALEQGQVKIYPSYYDAIWRKWVDDSEVWCLSRQLLWGHRIPAWKDESGEWHVNDSLSAVIDKCAAEGRVARENEFAQDPDVLDTWFSAALVPLVTAGWPKTLDERLYPLDVMHTGHDILGFWVVRQAMLCHHITNGEMPFPFVLLHGLLRDSNGRKMSKSLGNVIDPLDIIDGCSLEHLQERINEAPGLSDEEKELSCKHLESDYPNGIEAVGVDAMRLGLLLHPLMSASITLDVQQMITARKFGNKLWNAFLYCNKVWQRHEELYPKASDTRMFEVQLKEAVDDPNVSTLARLASIWIQTSAIHVYEDISKDMHQYAIHNISERLYTFAWQYLCDVYLELTKASLAKNASKEDVHVHALTLVNVLNLYLLQLSCAMPHLASEIRERLPEHLIKTTSTTLPEWKGVHDEHVSDDMTRALAVIDTSRSMRSAFELPKHEEMTVSLIGENSVWDSLQRCAPVLRHLGHISTEGGKCYATLNEFENREERNAAMLVMPVAKGFGHLVLRYEADEGVQRQMEKRLNERLLKARKRLEALQKDRNKRKEWLSESKMSDRRREKNERIIKVLERSIERRQEQVSELGALINNFKQS